MQSTEWEAAKRRFKVGSRVTGIVASHKPFGIFVDIGDPVATGLVQIIDFLDAGSMSPELYPLSAQKLQP